MPVDLSAYKPVVNQPNDPDKLSTAFQKIQDALNINLGGVYNVKDATYGAKGDGTTDDYAAILAAYNAIPIGGIGTIYLPDGLYRYTTPLAFTAAKSVTILGAGRGASVLLPEFTGTDAITITPGAANYATVSDFNVRGFYSGPGAGRELLTISGAAVATVHNVHLPNETNGGALKLDSIPSVFVDGLGGRATLNGSFLKINNCGGTIMNTQGIVAPQTDDSTSQPCVYLTNLNSLNFANCQFGGFGPRATYAITGIASTASTFTVTAPGHTFVADDILVVRGASVAAYNNAWRVASVTATTIVVNNTLNPGAATGGKAQYLSTCVYAGNESGPVNEWEFADSLFYDVGSTQTYGRADVYLDGGRSGSAYNITGASLADNTYDGADYGIVVASGALGTVAGLAIEGGTHNNKTCQLQIDGGVSALTYSPATPSGGTAGDDGVGPSAAVRIYGGTNVYKPTGIRLRGQLGQTRFQAAASAFTPYKYGVIIDDAGAAAPPQDITIDAHLFGSVQPVLFTGGGSSLAARRYTIREGNVNSGTIPVGNANYLPSIASAATIDLTNYVHDTIKITGTTNIATINGGWIKRQVTLLFAGALSLTTGGNLAVGANRTILVGDAVRLVFDGTSWWVR